MGGDYDPPIIYQLSRKRKMPFLAQNRHLVKFCASAQRKCIYVLIFGEIKYIFGIADSYKWGRPAVFNRFNLIPAVGDA
jgi:hypothetical protein